MLTQNELDSFKRQLEKSIKATETTLKHLDENLDFGDDIDHLDEEADETEEFANRLGTKQVLKEKVTHLKDALAKISGGKYGFCENCGRPIELEILHAVPESKLCRRCKQKELRK